MTSTTVAPPADAPTLVRAWRRPLRVHAAALGLLLLALMPLLGTERMFSADEGALQSQANMLATGKGWFLDHPRPDLDPTGELFLIHLSSIEGNRARRSPSTRSTPSPSPRWRTSGASPRWS